MLIFRRIVFYTLFFIYIVLCPLLLFYASGYTIDPLTREVERTGLVYLSTVPPGAHIYLEQSRFLHKTPATLDKLRAGEYRVMLDLPGYRTWIETVPVAPGKATVFDKVLLIPKDLHSQTMLEGVFKQITPLPGTDLLLVARGAELDSFQLYNIRNNKVQPLVDPRSSWRGFPVLSVFYEDDGHAMVIYGGGLWERKYLFVNFKADVPVITDITRLLSKDPLLIKWDPQDTNQIFAVYANFIDRIDVAQAAVYPKDIDGIKGCGFFNNRVYVMTADDRFLKYGHDKARSTSFMDEGLFDPAVLKKNVFYSIIVPDESFMFLLGEDGRLLSNNFPYELADRGVTGMKFYERTKALMYWTASSITVVRPSGGEGSAVKSLKMTSVFQGAQDIRQCFWVMDASHIVCNDSDRIFLVEFEPQGVQHSEFVASVKKGTSIFYSNETGCVYFLDEQGLFKKIQLLPKENVVKKFLNKGE
jgi:hypothetical protein